MCYRLCGAILWVCLLLLPQPLRAAWPTVEDMAGAMLMVGFRGTAPSPELLDAIEHGRIGGVILFDRDTQQDGIRNIVSPDQVRSLTGTLQKHARRPLLIAVDQEGGRVARLKSAQGFMELPSAEEMGRHPEAETYAHGCRCGEELRSLGININLAPVVDLRRVEESPGLGSAGRLFGRTSERVTAHARAFADGLLAKGIIPAFKHFPGLGSAVCDSHETLPDITDSWSDEELFPYRAVCSPQWEGLVLVAHVFNRNLDPVLPASLSPAVIEGLLRQKLRFEGVVISDDLGMGAVSTTYSLEERIRLAVLAGNDILLFGNNGRRYDPDLPAKAHEILIRLVHEGQIDETRLRASWKRLERLRAYTVGGRGKQVPAEEENGRGRRRPS